MSQVQCIVDWRGTRVHGPEGLCLPYFVSRYFEFRDATMCKTRWLHSVGPVMGGSFEVAVRNSGGKQAASFNVSWVLRAASFLFPPFVGVG